MIDNIVNKNLSVLLNLEENDKLKVEIIDSRIKYMSKNIQIVAKPV